MKLIDVLEKLSKGEIKNGTILTVERDSGAIYQYKYTKDCFLDDYHFPLNIYGENDLNREVTLIEPKPKEYYLRLDGYDDLSYINLNKYTCYEIAGKNEYVGYKTKFTQEEIDNDKFLKFVEIHGIKEVVDEDETD